MKNEKGLITRLINGIKEKFPEGKDLFGYEGIDKGIIIVALEENYQLLNVIEQKMETFDVIVLKRRLANHLKNATEFINRYGDGADVQDKFNGFLETITKIRSRIKETYFLVQEDCIRGEAEIIRLKEDAEALRDFVSDLKTLKESAESDLETIKQTTETIERIRSVVDGADESVSESEANITKSRAAIKEVQELVVRWQQEVAKGKVEYAALVEKIRSSNNDLMESVKSANELASKLESIEDSMENDKRINSELLSEIRETLDDANRKSMAGSFLTRKSELEVPIRKAEQYLNHSLLALVLVGTLAMATGFLDGVPTIEAVLIRMTLLFPLIWLAWNNSKKLGHWHRVSEDYAFKYAAAMAFEGYKKNAEDNDELKDLLLRTAITNMGENPTRLYNHKVDGTPLSEIASSIKDVGETALKSIKKIPGT